MHKVVQIITNDDGDPTDSRHWHLVFNTDATDRTLCTGEAFGFGESSAIFKEKSMRTGGVTCPRCMTIIKYFKALKV